MDFPFDEIILSYEQEAFAFYLFILKSQCTDLHEQSVSFCDSRGSFFNKLLFTASTRNRFVGRWTRSTVGVQVLFR